MGEGRQTPRASNSAALAGRQCSQCTLSVPASMISRESPKGPPKPFQSPPAQIQFGGSGGGHPRKKKSRPAAERTGAQVACRFHGSARCDSLSTLAITALLPIGRPVPVSSAVLFQHITLFPAFFSCSFSSPAEYLSHILLRCSLTTLARSAPCLNGCHTVSPNQSERITVTNKYLYTYLPNPNGVSVE